MKYTIILLLSILFSIKGNSQLMKGPELTEDNRAIFKLHAPLANEVKVINLSDPEALGAAEYEMVKDEQGNWEVTTLPCRPGLHYYELSIDGARVSDPASPAFFGWGKWTSCLEVPDPAVDFYRPKNVPHGDIRMHWYFSKTTESYRKCMVYLPPDYDQDLATRYPVLYLQHGAGESELGWTMQGKVNFILDNLISERKALPMIIVMDNGYAPSLDAENRHRPRGDDNLFEELVTTELIPLIDSDFRTLKNAEDRAIAGLSMGGGQALRIGLSHPELFASVGTFSGGGWGEEFNPGTSYDGVFNDPDQFNKTHKLFFIGCGTLERGYERLKSMHEKLQEHGVDNIWSEPYGSHEWQVWRYHLYDFAQHLFR